MRIVSILALLAAALVAQPALAGNYHGHGGYHGYRAGYYGHGGYWGHGYHSSVSFGFFIGPWWWGPPAPYYYYPPAYYPPPWSTAHRWFTASPPW